MAVAVAVAAAAAAAATAAAAAATAFVHPEHVKIVNRVATIAHGPRSIGNSR